mmetsp:Transcript_32843/g.83114  ORF Transcript_32843/g.83114 Transcript_32843/m.83114 type:complete len:163 (+) Transcript_32843:1370-1858(+)
MSLAKSSLNSFVFMCWRSLRIVHPRRQTLAYTPRSSKRWVQPCTLRNGAGTNLSSSHDGQHNMQASQGKIRDRATFRYSGIFASSSRGTKGCLLGEEGRQAATDGSREDIGCDCTRNALDEDRAPGDGLRDEEEELEVIVMAGDLWVPAAAKSAKDLKAPSL